MYNHTDGALRNRFFNLSLGRFAAGSIVAGTSYLVVGGSAGRDVTNVDVFDLESMSFARTLHLGIGRSYPGIGVLGPYVYVAGGQTAVGITQTVEVFDTRDWTQWFTENLTVAMVAGGSASVVGEAVFFVGGKNTSGTWNNQISYFTCGNSVRSFVSLSPPPFLLLPSLQKIESWEHCDLGMGCSQDCLSCSEGFVHCSSGCCSLAPPTLLSPSSVPPGLQFLSLSFSFTTFLNLFILPS